MKTKLIPLENKLIVKEIKEEYSGGLVKSNNEFDKVPVAEVIAVAEGVKTFEVGDVIIYNEYEGAEIPKMEGINKENDLIILDVNDVLLKVAKDDIKKPKDELGFKDK